uniref:Lipase domain-containing protein n=1 Tax=Glossina austeni TaxID=7395 RepID=A0A1A9V668_GLOAU
MNVFMFWILIIGRCLSECWCARLSYQKDNCEGSVFGVVQDVLRNEVMALLNPRFRILGSQRIHYDLYTPLNPYEGQILRTGDVRALKKSHFNPAWPVRIAIHGWAGKSTSCSNAALKDAYLSHGNFNVIIVDWSVISHDISYPRISQQLSEIAAHLVKFIRFLQREKDIELSKVYVIGHSAGSHIAGLAGKLLKPQQLGAIIALDPAGLAQLGLSADYRLAPDDALYVESIHTDTSHMGNPSFELSHAAFFPNWGQGQPQCPNATAAEFDFACDHFAALYYMAESVRNPKIFGAMKLSNSACMRGYNCTCLTGSYECPADAFMGGEPVVPKVGTYYLSTKANPPFGVGNVVRMRKVKKPRFLESTFPTTNLFRGFYRG